MRSLPVVVLNEGFGHFAHLLQRRGMMLRETLLLIAAVIPFYKPILLGVMWIADQHRHAQRLAKPDQGGGKVSTLRGAHPTCVPVPGNRIAECVLLKALGH